MSTWQLYTDENRPQKDIERGSSMTLIYGPETRLLAGNVWKYTGT